MIHRLKPYPEYKETAETWLGAIPTHWITARTKRLATINPSKSEVPVAERDQRVAFLPMERVGSDGRIRAHEHRPASELWTGFTYFRRDDVILAKITPCFENGKGACLDDLPTPFGFGSTEFHVLRSKGAASPQYLHRLTTHSEFRKLGAQSMTGSAGQQRVPDLFVSNFVFPLPPPAEQAAIVRFLGAVDRKVNRFVRAKRRLIEVLTEQKQAIITHAVTRGLNPNAPLKPSGIDWLGDVPAHWDVLPFVRCTIERADYRGATPQKVESGTYLVTAKNIRKGWIDYEASREYVRSDQYERIMRRGLPKLGDILFTTEAPLGHVALVDREDVALAQRIIRFRLDKQMLRPRFALAAMLSQYFQTQLELRATGSTASGIKASKLPQLQIVKPPTVGEQDEIVEHVDRKAAGINHAISDAQREIDLIREYRTRLVADVVTGKVDVRGVPLPDDDGRADLAAPIDETDGTADGDEAGLDEVPTGGVEGED